MIITRLACAVFVVLIFGSIAGLAAEDYVFLKVIHQRAWRLGMIDGKVGCYARLGGGEFDVNLPSIPADKSGMRLAFRWMRSGDTLQIDVARAQQAEAPSQREKQHWYLTAKYSDGGAEVVLTKEATKYSHWEFLDKTEYSLDIPKYHIRNINDLGKDAWLGIEDKGVRYTGHVEVRKPVLTPEKKYYIAVDRGEPN